MVEIVPSLLAADFARLNEEIASVEQAGARMLHFDVMDGHFVPNISIGVPVLKSVRRVTRLTLDVHLMISNPDVMAAAFIDAGADQITVHQEVCPHLDRSLRLIQRAGLKAGVAINPSTPVLALEEVLEIADFVLVMSVNPGFSGQMFLPQSLRKVAALNQRRRESGLGLPIEIDGGITVDNVADAVRAGCDWVVAGSSIFGSQDAGATLAAMQQIAREATAIRV